jgi:para-nitrobenzyl esterase
MLRINRQIAAVLSTWPLAVGAAFADAPPPTPVAAGEQYLAIHLLPASHHRQLAVSSPAFSSGGDIPFEYSGYRANRFPGLQWSRGPARTRSYVTVLQDADGLNGDDAILHWTVYDIPAQVTHLDRNGDSLPVGAQAGPNRNGPAQGYLGFRTGAGPKHRYPFQVFALDILIPPDPNLSWPALKAAMSGHVLASGDIIGLGQLDPTAAGNPLPAR